MSLFVALCLFSRFCYSLNDIFVGRLARRLGRMEVSTWRGTSLALSMAPLLFWVPREAWPKMGEHWILLLATVVVTAASNILQMQAARFLPFSLRAAFMVSGMAVGTTILGWFFLGDRLTPTEMALAILVVGSAVVAAQGGHASHEIVPDIRRGAAVALAAAAMMAVVIILVAKLARTTHPLLTAWAWEGGAGLILLIPLALRKREAFSAGWLGRAGRIAVASLPTALGSGASALALSLGAVGVWSAVAGTQVLFTAVLGFAWHQETMGLRRWICFGMAAAAVSGLAIMRR